MFFVCIVGSYFDVIGGVRELRYGPNDEFAAVVDEHLVLLDLAVVVGLAALARHHLPLDGTHHDIEDLRYHVEQGRIASMLMPIVGGGRRLEKNK